MSTGLPSGSTTTKLAGPRVLSSAYHFEFRIQLAVVDARLPL